MLPYTSATLNPEAQQSSMARLAAVKSQAKGLVSYMSIGNAPHRVHSEEGKFISAEQ